MALTSFILTNQHAYDWFNCINNIPRNLNPICVCLCVKINFAYFDEDETLEFLEKATH